MLSILLFLLFFSIPFSVSQDGIDSEDYNDVVKDPEEVEVNKTHNQVLGVLQAALLKKYDTHRRPVVNGSRTTEVKLFLHITHISIDEKDQSMRVMGHAFMTWTDEFLGWDITKHSVERVQFNRWDVWKPNIKIMNSIEGSEYSFGGNTKVTAVNLGKDKGARMETSPSFNFKLACEFDFYRYPNDINSCPIKFFTPLPMSEVNLKYFESGNKHTMKLVWGTEVTAESKTIVSDYEIITIIGRQFYIGINNNEVTSDAPVISTEYSDYFSLLHSVIFFKRHSPLFFSGILMPSLICATFNTLSFIIPTLSLACYTLMSTMFIQLIFLQDIIKKIPLAMSYSPPCIKFYSLIMISTILSLAIHFIFMILVNCRKEVPESFLGINRIRSYLPDSWKIEKDSLDKSWTTWINTLRPILAAFFLIIYIIAFFDYIVFG